MTTESKRVKVKRDRRIRTEFETLYSSDRQEGAGTLANISYSGAQLTGTSLRPAVGTKLRLYVFVQPISPFEVVGEVVRHSEDGFAMSIDDATESIRNFVDDAAAIVNVPKKRD